VLLGAVAGLAAVLFVPEFVAGISSDDPSRQPWQRAGALLGMSLGCAWIARQVWRGYRGGWVLAILVGGFLACAGGRLTVSFTPLGAVPALAGLGIVVLTTVPQAARAWFRPDRPAPAHLE
jgi:hypothetical protein